MIYKTSKPHPVENQISNDSARASQASIVYHVFDTMRHPRLQQDENADYADLENWIGSVRVEAKKYGLLKIANYKIGEVLAMCSKDDADGIWPRGEVRQVVEELADAEILKGIQIKEFNERGVHSDGYSYYTNLAEGFEADAEDLPDWPKTQNLLREIAKSDRQNAQQSKVQKDQYEAMPKL